ncbi:DUF4231 domain-containing protein [Nocardia beijingensis]
MAERVDPSIAPSPAQVVWEQLDGQRRYYARRSQRARRMYLTVKLAQIAVGAVVPVLAALHAPAFATATLAAVVVVGEGAQQIFQWQVHWLTYRGAAEELRREGFLYRAEVAPYSEADRHEILAQRIAQITAAENTAWSNQFRTASTTLASGDGGQSAQAQSK